MAALGRRPCVPRLFRGGASVRPGSISGVRRSEKPSEGATAKVLRRSARGKNLQGSTLCARAPGPGPQGSSGLPSRTTRSPARHTARASRSPGPDGPPGRASAAPPWPGRGARASPCFPPRARDTHHVQFGRFPPASSPGSPKPALIRKVLEDPEKPEKRCGGQSSRWWIQKLRPFLILLCLLVGYFRCPVGELSIVFLGFSSQWCL